MDKREYSFYFVGTPIGNFDEMSYRAVEILKSCDEIWCEDTLHSKPLLAHFMIAKPLQSFHKFSDESKLESCLKKLQDGKKIAYISDAGMPCISDPGSRIANMLIENGIDYTVVSGPCACVNALLLSGLNVDNFHFVGFLKDKQKEREEQINEIRNLSCTVVFYSSVHDINKDILYLYKALGDRECAVCREITKLYEEVVRGKLSEIHFDKPQGEYVICVGKSENVGNNMTMPEYLQELLKYEDSKDAIKMTAKKYNVPKNDVYQLYIDKFKK